MKPLVITKWKHTFAILSFLVAVATTAPLSGHDAPKPGPRVFRCPIEPSPGDAIFRAAGGSCGGGMNGLGWDGFGQNAATLFWHVEGQTGDLRAGQRAALLRAMQAWAGAAQITFQELPVANANQSIDFNFLTGDHSSVEAQEAGDPDCAFISDD